MATVMGAATATEPSKRLDRVPRQLKISRFPRLRLAPRTIVVGLCAIIAAFVAVPGPLGEFLNDRNPILAARLLDDPGAQVSLWSLKTYQNLEERPDESILSAAREALRNNPSHSAALSALGLYHSLRQDAAGQRLAVLAEQITRRNRLAQVVLAQNAAREGDGEQAMGHLVKAIRTTDEGRNEIYAIVSRLAANAELRQALAQHVDDGASWSVELIRFMKSDLPAGPINAARIMLAADPAESEGAQRALNGELFAFLIEAGELDLLRQLHARMTGGKTGIVTTPGFTQETIDPRYGWLAWHGADASYGVDFTKADDRVVPIVYANQSDRGAALSRTMMLPPGRYALTERRVLIDGGKGSAVWQMSCLDGGKPRVAWTGPATSLSYSVAGVPGPAIGADCTVQTFALIVEGARDGAGFEMTIDKFALERAN